MMPTTFGGLTSKLDVVSERSNGTFTILARTDTPKLNAANRTPSPNAKSHVGHGGGWTVEEFFILQRFITPGARPQDAEPDRRFLVFGNRSWSVRTTPPSASFNFENFF